MSHFNSKMHQIRFPAFVRLSLTKSLPVRQRVTFKLAVLVFKALQGLTPRYLADDCRLITDAGRRYLRSSDWVICVVQRTNTRIGDRAFSFLKNETINADFVLPFLGNQRCHANILCLTLCGFVIVLAPSMKLMSPQRMKL